MILGKPLAMTWQDALGMVAHCQVLKVELPGPGDLQLLLRDPAGQQFVLRVVGAAAVGLTGNLISLNAALQITCHEVPPSPP